MLRSIYTEYQYNCCDVTNNITLIKVLRFLNKPSKSLLKWVATPIDQIWCKCWWWDCKSIIDAQCKFAFKLSKYNFGYNEEKVMGLSSTSMWKKLNLKVWLQRVSGKSEQFHYSTINDSHVKMVSTNISLSQSMWPSLAPIFFMTYFTGSRGGAEACPLDPLLMSLFQTCM